MKLKKMLWLIPLFIVIIFFFGNIRLTSPEPPPPPPNFSDPQGALFLDKKGDNYWITYRLNGEESKYPVGKSETALDQYVGKQVKIDGDFPESALSNWSKVQCIKDKCHKIEVLWWGQEVNYSVINIKSIQAL